MIVSLLILLHTHGLVQGVKTFLVLLNQKSGTMKAISVFANLLIKSRCNAQFHFIQLSVHFKLHIQLTGYKQIGPRIKNFNMLMQSLQTRAALSI